MNAVNLAVPIFFSPDGQRLVVWSDVESVGVTIWKIGGEKKARTGKESNPAGEGTDREGATDTPARTSSPDEDDSNSFSLGLLLGIIIPVVLCAGVLALRPWRWGKKAGVPIPLRTLQSTLPPAETNWAIRHNCVGCGAGFELPREMAGKVFRCASCGAAQVVSQD